MVSSCPEVELLAELWLPYALCEELEGALELLGSPLCPPLVVLGLLLVLLGMLVCAPEGF
jgi:hypothetical protein